MVTLIRIDGAKLKGLKDRIFPRAMFDQRTTITFTILLSLLFTTESQPKSLRVHSHRTKVEAKANFSSVVNFSSAFARCEWASSVGNHVGLTFPNVPGAGAQQVNDV